MKFKSRPYTVLSAFCYLSLYIVLTSVESSAAIDDPSKLSLCHLSGLQDQVYCGVMLRPENPDDPQGKTIPIHYAVLPAIKESAPQEAMLAIAGGPGQSAIELAGHFNRTLQEVRQQRDVLLIDQRGTGASNLLHCDEFEGASSLDFDEATMDVEAENENCRTQIDTNLSWYNSRVALEDFEAVREHLGYQRLHLFGTSYGTRMVQLYMRHYPEQVATAVMDGVVPLDQNVLAVGQSVDRAMALLFEQCAAQAACANAFGDLERSYREVLASLEEQALLQGVSHPSSAASENLRLDKAKLAGVLRLALYSSQARVLIPYAIDRLKSGDAQPVLGLLGLAMEGLGLANGMHAAIVCAEDWPRLDDKQRADLSNSFIGEKMLLGLDQSCPLWAVKPSTDDFTEALQSDIPSLLLSGHYDPATPPAWADHLSETLTNAKHVVFPYATHSVAGQTCAPKLMAELIDGVPPAELNDSCRSRNIERLFFIDANGPGNMSKTKALNSNEEGGTQ